MKETKDFPKVKKRQRKKDAKPYFKSGKYNLRYWRARGFRPTNIYYKDTQLFVNYP